MRPAPGEPRFQAGQAFTAWLIAAVVALSGQVVLLAATGYTDTDPVDRPIWLDAILLLPLWFSLLACVVYISRKWGTGSLPNDYGLRFRVFDLLGVPVGIVTQAALIPALYWVLHISSDEVNGSARSLTDRAKHPGEVVLLVLMVVVGAPIVEELFFRGLLMRSIEARWNDGLALVVSAVFFALVHFEPILIPGLIVFGLISGTCAQRTGRLGMSIFAHAAFNGTAVLMLLR